MRGHGLLGEIEFHIGAAFAALTIIGQSNIMRVRHKVGGHEEAAGDFALATEVAFGIRIEPVDKRVVIVENEIDVMEEIDYEAGISDRKITRRFAAAGVKVLVVSVEGNRKESSRPPLERMLFPVPLPDGCGTVAFGHINHLFIEMPLWLGLSCRRNFADIRIIDPTGAVQHHKGTGYAL